jgi:hypothetical protein
MLSEFCNADVFTVDGMNGIYTSLQSMKWIMILPSSEKRYRETIAKHAQSEALFRSYPTGHRGEGEAKEWKEKVGLARLSEGIN